MARALEPQGLAVTALPGLAGLSSAVGLLLPQFAVIDLAPAHGDEMDALEIVLDQSPLTLALVLTGPVGGSAPRLGRAGAHPQGARRGGRRHLRGAASPRPPPPHPPT